MCCCVCFDVEAKGSRKIAILLDKCKMWFLESTWLGAVGWGGVGGGGGGGGD